MLEWYILGVIGFALGFDQHRSIIISTGKSNSSDSTSVLFDLTAWIGGISTIFVLLAGFYFGKWWWPILAMAIGTFINYTGRNVIPLEYRFIVSLSGVFLGFGSTIIFFQ